MRSDRIFSLGTVNFVTVSLDCPIQSPPRVRFSTHLFGCGMRHFHGLVCSKFVHKTYGRWDVLGARQTPPDLNPALNPLGDLSMQECQYQRSKNQHVERFSEEVHIEALYMKSCSGRRPYLGAVPQTPTFRHVQPINSPEGVRLFARATGGPLRYSPNGKAKV